MDFSKLKLKGRVIEAVELRLPVDSLKRIVPDVCCFDCLNCEHSFYHNRKVHCGAMSLSIFDSFKFGCSLLEDNNLCKATHNVCSYVSDNYCELCQDEEKESAE